MRPFRAATRPASHPSTPIKTRLSTRGRFVLDIGNPTATLGLRLWGKWTEGCRAELDLKEKRGKY